MTKSTTRPDLSRRSVLRRRIGCRMGRYRKFSDLVALFVNTVVFECRRTPSSALRSLRRTAGGTPPSRALSRSCYDPLDSSPYLRTEPLEILQYVFSQKTFCALPVAPLQPLMTITHAISGLRSCNFPDNVLRFSDSQVRCAIASGGGGCLPGRSLLGRACWNREPSSRAYPS